MHYYQDPVQTKRIYISPISLEDTGMTYLGFYSNPDRRMVLAALFPDEEGMSFEEI